MTSARTVRTFKIAGEFEVNRLGFGAMRITGLGVWGEPAGNQAGIGSLDYKMRDLALR